MARGLFFEMQGAAFCSRAIIIIVNGGQYRGVLLRPCHSKGAEALVLQGWRYLRGLYFSIIKA